MANERNNNYYKKRNPNKRNNFRQNNRHNSYNRQKPRAVETIEDVQQDILRIEKEIELEIREIRNVKLGL